MSMTTTTVAKAKDKSKREQWFELRQTAEKEIARAVVQGMLAYKYYIGDGERMLKAQVSVFDGEEIALVRSTDVEEVMGALFSTDEDTLLLYLEGKKDAVGRVRLIYGNTGWDVMADWTLGLDRMEGEILKGAHLLSKHYEALLTPMDS